MISQKARYAFKALLRLAAQSDGTALQIGSIAQRERIPRKFLEQILLELKRAGLIASLRGRAGGYSLAKSPADILVRDVLRIIDGPIAPLPCISLTAYRRCEDCPDEGGCGVRRLFAEAYRATLDVLDRTSLADGIPPSILEHPTARSSKAQQDAG